MADRHSFIAFYVSKWKAGTAQMPRLHRSVYFDVCAHMWEKAEPCPAHVLPLMLGDIPNWRDLIEDLVSGGKLVRTADGSLVNDKALEEGQKAFLLWQKKSSGGRDGANKTNRGRSKSGTADGTPAGVPSAESENPPGVPTQIKTEIKKEREGSVGEDTTPPRAASQPSFALSESERDDEMADPPGVLVTSKRGTRFPGDAILPLEWAQFCREKRPDLDPEGIFAEFRDYWVAQPGQGGVKLDWAATWRNWVRRQRAGPNTGTGGRSRTMKALDDIERGEPHRP